MSSFLFGGDGCNVYGLPHPLNQIFFGGVGGEDQIELTFWKKNKSYNSFCKRCLVTASSLTNVHAHFLNSGKKKDFFVSTFFFLPHMFN